MSYRLANSLIELRDQINAAHPGRSKVSDGWIGNAEHASRSSDHNPWVMDGKIGVVTAIDITHDPRNGVDSYALAEALRANPDPRLKYVISNGRIASRSVQNFQWRKYTGKNKHDHHVHVSVESSKKLYDDAARWSVLSGAPISAHVETAPELPPLLRSGSHGLAVERLQTLLNAKGGAKLDTDGDFMGKTEKAVRDFQTKAKLVVDGKVGPGTWKALGITDAKQLT